MIAQFGGKHPRIDPSAFIVNDATIIGDVEIGPQSNIWFQCVVRGDTNYISIGARCNIQDACGLHVVMDRYPVILEDYV
ncbi:MAG: gamma carbonic anhydrase family protein, partial [Syntrophorhabdus sp.]